MWPKKTCFVKYLRINALWIASFCQITAEIATAFISLDKYGNIQKHCFPFTDFITKVPNSIPF